MLATVLALTSPWRSASPPGARPGPRSRRSARAACSPSAPAPARRPSPTSTRTTSGWASPSTSWSRRVVPALAKKVGKPIKVEKKESTPPTRIPLLTSQRRRPHRGDHDRHAARRDSVDFSLTFFVTGAQFLVKKGSPIKGIHDIAGKRVAAQQGSTNAKIIREQVPSAQLARVPRPARRLPGAGPGPGRRLHQRRHPARRPQGQGPEARRLRGRRRLLLLRALRHGHAQGRLGLQGGRRRRPQAGSRVGQVLRAVRQVVRPQGRGAVSDDRRGKAFLCS